MGSSCLSLASSASWASAARDSFQILSNQVRWSSFESGAKSIHIASPATPQTAIHQCPVAAAATPVPANRERLYGFRNA